MAAYVYKLTVRVYRPGERTRESIGTPHGPPLAQTLPSRYYPTQRHANLVHRYAGYIEGNNIQGFLDDMESHFRVDGEATGYP